MELLMDTKVKGVMLKTSRSILIPNAFKWEGRSFETYLRLNRYV